MFRNPADILNYGGIKCYPVYWVRTRGRVVAGSKYYLNKNKNKNNHINVFEVAQVRIFLILFLLRRYFNVNESSDCVLDII